MIKKHTLRGLETRQGASLAAHTFCPKITIPKVKKALARMHTRKATKKDDITIEA